PLTSTPEAAPTRNMKSSRLERSRARMVCPWEVRSGAAGIDLDEDQISKKHAIWQAACARERRKKFPGIRKMRAESLIPGNACRRQLRLALAFRAGIELALLAGGN